MDESIEKLNTKAFDNIKKADKILAVCHYNPDGDGIASLCALGELFSSLKKDYILYCQDEPNSPLFFLPHYNEIQFTFDNQSRLSGKKIDFASFDLIIICDCGSISRTGLEKEIKLKQKNQIIIEFDHHPNTEKYSNIEIRDRDASATCEVIYNFFKTNKITISKPAADCLLTGIIADTGNFVYSSTTEKTVRAASELLKRGANQTTITQNIFRNKSLSGLKLWGQALSDLTLNQRYGIAIAAISYDDFKKYNVSREELEGIANFLGKMAGVRAVIFLREEQEGVIKGSIRTTTDFDVSKVAKLLGGGGHPSASGFTIKGKIVCQDKKWRVM